MQPLYRDADHIIRAHSVWQHTSHGAAWTVRAVVDGMVHVESMDSRDRTEIPLADLLGNYVEI